MEDDGGDTLEGLRREVHNLRERVRELQRKAAKYQDSPDRGLQESLSEREELLMEAERIAHMGSWAWNLDTNAVFWSEELYRILGYDPEADEPGTEAFFAAVHPDDRERAQQISAQGIEQGIAPQVDFRVQRKDGSIRFATMTGAILFDAGGAPRRVVGAVLDLTEARSSTEAVHRTNELLEEAQKTAQLGSWALDVKSDALEWSREFYRILGVSPATTPSTELFLSRVHPDDRERLQTIHAAVLATGEGQEGEARIVRPDGEIRHVRVRGVAHADSDGSPVVVRGTMLDVTDQVELQQRLLHSQKMEAIGRLAGGIAHDFNNLLTVALGNLELLSDDLDHSPQGSEAPAREVEDAMRALQSAKDLTQRLLAFGKKARLERKLVDPNQLTKTTLRLMRRVIGDQVKIVSELDDDVDTMRVDPVQVEQALINLIVNARDAVSSGGTIIVGSRMVALEGKRFVELSVADNGPGLSAEMQKRVFEPFFTTKEGSKGTGLGLATALGTVEQHGGSIAVQSQPGEGTTFRMWLPAAERTRSEDAQPVDRSRMDTDAPAARILIVEDQEMVGSVMLRMLERDGHKPLLAQNAQQAQALWEAHPDIALVVCDIVMPDMRGPQLIEQLRRRGADPKVLFVTGYSEEALNDSLSAPVLTKPFSPTSLQQAVNDLLA